ncbi:MAG: RNA polymerase sigma-70 factor [Bacteroidota bacterium]|nr:RNA polymerase sigma-70 factor [Bacteroidota bacterium]
MIRYNKNTFINKKDLKKFFDKYYRALCHFATSYIKDNSLAEDIVQDTFIYIWENKSSFSDEISTKVFLYRAVKNRCLNYNKHLSVKNAFANNQTLDRLEENLFYKNYIREETIRLIYEAIESLYERCKNIIDLSLKGLKNEDIAKVLDLSVNTVKTHKKTAYKFLRIKLKDILPISILLLEITSVLNNKKR